MLNSINYLNKHYNLNPQKIIFEDLNQSYTIREFYNLVNQYSNNLTQYQNKNIGIVGFNSVNYSAADCGISSTNNTLVPIPNFFNDEMISNLIKDSNIDLIFSDNENFERIKNLFQNTELFFDNEKNLFKKLILQNHKRIIYTSGTTRNPKGVVQTDKQMNIVIQNLLNVFNIQSFDKYFSILPISTLLEQICATHITLQANSKTIFNSSISKNVFSLNEDQIQFILNSLPNLLCLAPHLLGQIIDCLEKKPNSLFNENIKAICVGGSKSPQILLDKGINQLKLPIYEGYGLSEFCSVVAVNDKINSKIGTSGKILPNIKCEIVNDEIVLSGPTKMEGYFPNEDNNPKFYTGDIGSLNKEGFLTVYGRKDEVLILDNGRNIHPEYIKQLLKSKLDFKEIYIYQDQEQKLCFAFDLDNKSQINKLIDIIQNILPKYIQPKKIFVLEKEINKKIFLSANGKIDLSKISKYFQSTNGAIQHAIL